MAMGLSKSPNPDYFDVLAKLPVTKVSKKDVHTDFLSFEQSSLQPLWSRQPAALLSADFKRKHLVWEGYEEWTVTPKHQHLVMERNGLGTLDEIVRGEEIKLSEFLTKNKHADEMMDTEAFQCKSVPGIRYVNDINLSNEMVKKGNLWSLFGDLGLDKLSEISGINTPWGYAGTRGSVFPVHLEDSDLGSVNHHLDGANKVWFFVHPDDRDKFIDGLKKMYPNGYEMCSTYHRHKFMFVDPVMVKQTMNITVTTVIQRPGDMVVTWPGTFHWGYNTGLNVNMAVNYCPRGEMARKIVSSARQCTTNCKIGSTISPPIHKVFEETPYKCTVKDCPWEGCTSPQGVKAHLHKCHGIEVKIGEIAPVPCKGCGMMFKKLADHLKICAKPIPVSCNLCSKVVQNRRKHWLSGCKTCKWCHREFRSRKLAYDHFEHV